MREALIRNPATPTQRAVAEYVTTYGLLAHRVRARIYRERLYRPQFSAGNTF